MPTSVARRQQTTVGALIRKLPVNARAELRQAKCVDPDVAEFLADVDRGLQPHLNSALARIPDIHPLKEGVTYQVTSGGKRIRAALCVTTSEMFGTNGSRALDFAATIEHLQNFSLIHDDIADGDTQRRYHESIWKRFGVAHGINIGDTFALFASLGILDSSYSENVKLGLLKLVSEYGLEMIVGQALDINMRQNDNVTENEYMDCTRKKTGAFLAMAAVGGGIIGGADVKYLSLLREFALLAGTAFQIKDDILDIHGFKGRDNGSDILEGKRTLLLIHALREASLPDRSRLLHILNKRRNRKTAEEVQWACDVVRKTGAIEYAELISTELVHQACGYLFSLPDNEPKNRLIRISTYLSQRIQ